MQIQALQQEVDHLRAQQQHETPPASGLPPARQPDRFHAVFENSPELP